MPMKWVEPAEFERWKRCVMNVANVGFFPVRHNLNSIKPINRANWW